ncbi:hypothetical protein [Phytohabitans aurantiacus]|uniref:PH domain-containing protein n=1 Tax=Phytohabitans aurantiacus TaxID=3016789 RepID=A0ABQ5QQ61_9ACTN|nr:hypothetical protein [Phytohabitans aurantiacus]GLH96377.1 hypothetical protein Pa4123_16510 [Phytohabitans aurantiacus]
MTWQRSSIGPSRTVGWLAVVVCGVLTAVVPTAGWTIAHLPSIVAAPAATLCMALALWRFDLAPRAAWNAHGVALRTGWHVVATRWNGVESVRLTRSAFAGDRLAFRMGGRRFDVGLDRVWWLARPSSRYATRSQRLYERIQLAREQATDAVSDGEPPSLSRFAPLAGVLACWSGGLGVALLLG